MRYSAEALALRKLNLPVPHYPEGLPIVARREEIARTIRENQVVIICGETGSGKTTQLPKICLELERGVKGMIGHTQPRRIAARTVASRIAEELKSPLGQAVGYKIRFSDKVSSGTYIKLMTDGILLAETQGDPLLRQYDTLIIDEAHERSLNIDFLLGYLKPVLAKRADLKLIVTSATIDAQRFAQHFSTTEKPVPVIEVSGRMYPVEIRYRPLKQKNKDLNEPEEDLETAMNDAVDDLLRQTGSGDILIFLPGEREIREAADSLVQHKRAGVEIMPLFSRLSFEDQERVFKPHHSRRIVLATNVAETSVTVPGIRYVIDPGLVRLNRYSYRNKVELLQVEKISRASANQRAGRCGRVAAGICVRLYTEQEFVARSEFTEPEILRSSLASVILKMKSLKIGNVEDFPFLEAPQPRMIHDGYQLLSELGAVDDARELTPIGWQLAQFPIDARIARVIIQAKQENCLNEILIIAAALSVQDPRDRPFEQAEAADRSHQLFQDERSDFLSYLKIWDFFTKAVENKKSNKQLQNHFQSHFLSYRRLREWRDIHSQLVALTQSLDWKVNQIVAGFDSIHRALLAGLLGNLGFKNEEGEYLGARGIKFSIFPGSVLRKAQPKWVMAAELVETSRLYARTVAKLDPEWIEPIAQAMVKHHYFDPHWEKERAMVIAYERVSLYGLTVVAKRSVHYGPINPLEAREIFIRRALVEGDFNTRADFFVKNQLLLKQVQELEHKTRKRDVLVDEQTIYSFYNAVLPADIYNGAAFERWREEIEKQQPRVLYLTREFIMRHAATDVTEVQFPETLTVSGAIYRLRYRFEPGHVLDGVSLTVPLHLLNTLQETPFDWIVPGLIRDKVGAYLKALPKNFRRQLFPLPEQVTAFLEWADTAKPFLAVLAEFVVRRCQQPLSVAVWDGADIPVHLKMNFRVIDDAGRELLVGRDLAALQLQLGQAAELTFAKLSQNETSLERENIRTWDFGDLPEKITFHRAGRKLTGYPALTDEKDSVAIKLYDVESTAQAQMRWGVVRLMRLALKDQMKQLEKALKGFDQCALQLRPLVGVEALRADVLSAIADRAFIGEDLLPRNQKDYELQLKRGRTRLPAVSEGACRLLAAVSSQFHLINLQINQAKGVLQRPAMDLQQQISQLLFPGFLGATPWPQLSQLPRYLMAMQKRLEKFPRDMARDALHAGQLNQWWKRYEALLEKDKAMGERAEALSQFRWHLEELRVSLYAQELKTPYPISYKRLEKFWQSLT
jgi:ATP-dependent helicase HrpA